MRTLLSLPQNLISAFHELTKTNTQEFFVASDPIEKRIGSGGGTAFLLAQHWQESGSRNFENYLSSEKRIIIHAGGESRRLPAYAPSGKILTPIPVFRWSRGQRLDQTLLDLQLPLYKNILDVSHAKSNTLIASGDTLILAPKTPSELPEADVVCFGIWVDPGLASRHGVIFTPRNNPSELDFMLQKPKHEEIERLTETHLFLMDIGIWLLSPKAISILMKKSGWQEDHFKDSIPNFYDLYSTFGACLGRNPSQNDSEIAHLSVAIVPLENGEFYHYGTSQELITSTEKIQNRIQDQRSIWHHRVKPHPTLFVHNSIAQFEWNGGHNHIWIENSQIPASWKLTDHHVITGVLPNSWNIELRPGFCLDIIPIGKDKFCIRPYHINDTFSGDPNDFTTKWLGESLKSWLSKRQISIEETDINKVQDIQSAAIFPVMEKEELSDALINWMFYASDEEGDCKKTWLNTKRLSAREISAQANLKRLFEQRQDFMLQNFKQLSVNYKHSVFYQIDLKNAAQSFASGNLDLPEPLPASESPMISFRDHMFRSEVLKKKGEDGQMEEQKAFTVLQNAIIDSIDKMEIPRLDIYSDQIVWGRSPIRLDLAGGWSDTPPLCLQNGGSVLNIAVDLNGQPPLQVFIRLSTEAKIILRSIDNGVSEEITSYNELKDFNRVGSAFSIPRAALCLAGFHPDFCGAKYNSLKEQLKDFGGGFEISLLAAIPKGSGLGTSSILAGTVLGVLSDFCQLNWNHQQICHRTLILEQLLTTGGGWQDQYGGILPGVKLLESLPGMQETMSIRWLPDLLFTQQEFKEKWLLYYTGITRVAKNILAEIVRGMFLNEGHRLRILDEIKQHAYTTANAIQKCDYEQTGRMIAHSWKLNNALDPGTNTPEVQSIIDKIADLTLGFKLLGAGGGGYMLISAKDEDAVSRIHSVLTNNPPNGKARFVKMDLSHKGFQVSRS